MVRRLVLALAVVAVMAGALIGGPAIIVDGVHLGGAASASAQP